MQEKVTVWQLKNEVSFTQYRVGGTFIIYKEENHYG